MQAEARGEQWFFRQSSQITQSVEIERSITTPGPSSNRLGPTEIQVQTAIRKALRLESGDEVSYRSETQHEAMQSILYED